MVRDGECGGERRGKALGGELFEVELNRFPQIAQRALYSLALAGRAGLGIQGNISTLVGWCEDRRHLHCRVCHGEKVAVWGGGLKVRKISSKVTCTRLVHERLYNRSHTEIFFR
jgi:hypothetical protein